MITRPIRNIAAFIISIFLFNVVVCSIQEQFNIWLDKKIMVQAKYLADEMYASESHARVEMLGHKYADMLLDQPIMFKHDGEIPLGFDEPQHMTNRKNYVEKNMLVEATAYWTHDPVEASGDGIAFDGTEAIAYQTIAVDPKVIPLQSEVYVPTIGWCRANDTGNAIKGKIIDVSMPNRDKAWEWGRRLCYVKVRMPRKG